MHAANGPSPHAAAWFVEPDRDSAKRRARREALARRRGATSTRAAIVASIFLVLVATGLLFGGHAAIDPLLHLATTARDSRATSDVVIPMPDGQYCRHMSFDNATSEMVEGTIEPCPDSIVRRPRGSDRSFMWGGQ
ncbi:MAG: hypothetical protein WA652_06330 [Xanthobacteraceae bacterium]